MSGGISEAAFHLLALSTTITFAYVGFDKISSENGYFSSKLRDTRKGAVGIAAQLKPDSFGSYINDLLRDHKRALGAIYFFKREALASLNEDIIKPIKKQSEREFKHFDHFECASDAKLMKKFAILGNLLIFILLIIYQILSKYNFISWPLVEPFLEVLSVVVGFISLGVLIYLASVAHGISVMLDSGSAGSWIAQLRDMETFINKKETAAVSGADIAG